MKLMTWNIQWGRGVDGRVDLDRVVGDAQRFADFDVLCLQEVSAGQDQLPGCDGSDQFEQLAARLRTHEPVVGVATDVLGTAGGRRRFGNMLFSRLPVRQVFRHLLPWPVADRGMRLAGHTETASSRVEGAEDQHAEHEGIPMSMQRVAIEATLDTPLGPLRVTTTHLEYYAAQQRAAQIDRLRELHHEAVSHSRVNRPGTPADGAFEPVPRAAAAVLMGDFNFRPDDPDRARLLAPIDAATPKYLDAWELAHPGRRHEPTVGVHDDEQWPGPPFTFDFIFISADIASRVRDIRVDARTTASDHQPVLLELA